jgi:hypothetical protein
LLPYSLSLCFFPSWLSMPFRLSLPFVLSFICVSVFMFACFFSQLPKQLAEQFRAFVKTVCSSHPKLLLLMVLQNQLSRPSDCALMELHSCHFYVGSDLAKLFSVWQTLYNGSWTRDVDLWKI